MLVRGMKMSCGLLLSGALLLSAATSWAATLNEYVEQRPVIKQSMYVRITIFHEAKMLAKQEHKCGTCSDLLAEQGDVYGARAVKLLQSRCTNGTLEAENGIPAESSCKVLMAIED